MDITARRRPWRYLSRGAIFAVVVALVITVIVLSTRPPPTQPSSAPCKPCGTCPPCVQLGCTELVLKTTPASFLFSPTYTYMMYFEKDKLNISPRFGTEVIVVWSIDAPGGYKFGVNTSGQLFYTKRWETQEITLTPASTVDGRSYTGSLSDDGKFQIRTPKNIVIFST